MNRPAMISKWVPNGGRGQLIVSFEREPVQQILDSLCNALDSQGYETSRHGESFAIKFWTSNSHVSDDKVVIAKQSLHRSGYQRHDEAWEDQETADDLFGWDAAAIG